jgi:secreted trypsin-like serine protease
MLYRLLICLSVVFSCASFASSGTDSSSDEITTYISNGTETSTSTFGDFVSLFYDRRAYDGVYGTHSFCGGTMLADQYVLTAAHCIFDGYGQPNTEYMLYMAVGQVDDENNFPSSVTTVRASEFYYFSSYSDSSSDLWENDIAIIKLASPLSVSSHVNRVSDETLYRDSSNSFVAVGHGNTSQGVGTSTLHQASITYVDNTTCQSSTSTLSGLHDSQICFTGPTNSTTSLLSGVCSGDSGGPVYWNNSGTYVQVGITSFGPVNCGTGLGTAKITGVFTEIADYSTWITNVLNGSTSAQYTATDAKRQTYYDTYLSSSSGFYSAPSYPVLSSSSDDSSGGGSIGFYLLGLLAIVGFCRARKII